MKANNAETPESSSNTVDTLKGVVAIVLLVIAVVGNAIFSGNGSFTVYQMHVVARAAGVIVLVATALAIMAITDKGKVAINFAREARTEVRKVVWPTRQETMQTTLIVLVVSVVMALVLWGIDGIMVRLVAFVTGV